MTNVRLQIDCSSCGKLFPICHASVEESSNKWDACRKALNLESNDGAWLVYIVNHFKYCENCAEAKENK